MGADAHDRHARASVVYGFAARELGRRWRIESERDDRVFGGLRQEMSEEEDLSMKTRTKLMLPLLASAHWITAAACVQPSYEDAYQEERDPSESARGTEGFAARIERGAQGSARQFATITGKFIDENDLWPDGKVPAASINVYSLDDNSLLAGTSTDQNGFYSLAGPFFGEQVRLVATPPPGARCPKGAQSFALVVDSFLKEHDFKDECKF